MYLSTGMLGFVALSSLVSAGPLVRRAIDATELRNITLYGQYAAAAYCDANRNPTVTNPLVACGAGNCNDVQIARATLAAKLGPLDSVTYRTGGFVAIDPINQVIVASFQGTDGRTGNTIANNRSAGRQTPVSYCNNCSAATGYLEAFREVQDKVVTAITSAQITHPNYQVVTTGHSLGGALATIAAAELRSRGIPVHLASFGMPRTVNPSFATFLSGQGPPSNGNNGNQNFRVTHDMDLVPNSNPLEFALPGQASVSSRHITPSYAIHTPNGVVPTANDLDIVDRDGISQKQLPPLDSFPFPSHGFYINAISACF